MKFGGQALDVVCQYSSCTLFVTRRSDPHCLSASVQLLYLMLSQPDVRSHSVIASASAAELHYPVRPVGLLELP